MAVLFPYNINIADTTGDTYTVVVRYGATAPTDGTVIANGGTTAGNLHVAIQKAVEAVKDSASLNGHN